MKLRLVMAAILAAGLFSLASPSSSAQDETKVVGVEETVTTVDGVLLRSVFYNAVNPMGGAAKAPVVVFLHGYGQNPDDGAFEDTAKLIAKKGYHVVRFDFRGHGKSKDMTPGVFWTLERNQPWAAINSSPSMIANAGKATKQTIDVKEFRPNYYPMLVQDIAAIRNHLDKKNDNSLVNSSTIYLVTTGDAINLAMFFLASEYTREAKRPNFDNINLVVSPARQVWDGFDPAGLDIRGVIALSPANPKSSGSFNHQLMNQWVFGIKGATQMRTNTYWQFLYAKEDGLSASNAANIFRNVLKISDSRLKVKPKYFGPDNKELPYSEQSFLEPVEKTKAVGVKLLGNNLGTEEKILAFIDVVEKERGKRERVNNRNWSKPLYIAPDQFRLMK